MWFENGWAVLGVMMFLVSAALFAFAAAADANDKYIGDEDKGIVIDPDNNGVTVTLRWIAFGFLAGAALISSPPGFREMYRMLSSAFSAEKFGMDA